MFFPRLVTIVLCGAVATVGCATKSYVNEQVIGAEARVAQQVTTTEASFGKRWQSTPAAAPSFARAATEPSAAPLAAAALAPVSKASVAASSLDLTKPIQARTIELIGRNARPFGPAKGARFGPRLELKLTRDLLAL